MLHKKRDIINIPRKPLENYKKQDQNSFGTCYANAVSTAVYAATGEEPSYHQIALSYTTDNTPDGELKTRKPINNNGAIFSIASDSDSDLRINQGGWECASLKSLKKEPFICKRGSTLIENESDRSGHKVEFHEALADFYDHSSDFRSLPKEEKEKLIKSISSLQKPRNVTNSHCQTALLDLYDGKNLYTLPGLAREDDDRTSLLSLSKK